MEAMNSVNNVSNLFFNAMKLFYDAGILCNVTLVAGDNGQRFEKKKKKWFIISIPN